MGFILQARVVSLQYCPEHLLEQFQVKSSNRVR